VIKKQFYYSFRFFSSTQRRVRRRLTPPGLLVFNGLVISVGLGLDTTQTMIFQVFTFLLSLFTISLVYSLFFRSPFVVRRIIPRFATKGQPIKYRLIIKNGTDKIQRGLHLIEDLTDPRPSFEEFTRSSEPGEETRNLFDRYVGFFRWQWLISQKKVGAVKEKPLPTFQPKSEIEIRHEILPLRRGMMMFSGVTIARPDPFGLFKSLVTLPVKQSIRVLPKRYSLPPIQLSGIRKYQRGGVALASSIGDSEEFVSLRDYRPGDPLQRIHWKSWARIGKPIVKEYQEEFFVRHTLILDTFLKKDYSEAFEEAVSLAASYVCTINTMESLLDLMFVGRESYCITSGRGLANMDKMLEILSSVKLCADKPFESLYHSVINHAHSLSGCICILLAWDQERRDLISHLGAMGIPLLVLVIKESKLGDELDDPGPMKNKPEFFHILEVGKIEEGLAKL